MQAWKYVLDWFSDAPLLAVLDDDACLLDHVLPRGDLETCDDKIVVRGVRFERRPGNPTKHEASNAFLGVDSDVNFMVDGPERTRVLVFEGPDATPFEGTSPTPQNRLLEFGRAARRSTFRWFSCENISRRSARTSSDTF